MPTREWFGVACGLPFNVQPLTFGISVDSRTNPLKPTVPVSRRIYNGPAPGWMGVARGAALGLACLLTLNLMEVLVHGTSAVENWFCSLQPLTQPMCIATIAMAATSLLLFSMKPGLPGPVWFATLGLVLLFAGFCGRELWQIAERTPDPIRITAMARPLGILMLLAVGGIGVLTGNADSVRGRSSLLAIVCSSAVTIVAFAVVTIQSGGLSDALPDESLPVILVLGCGLNADGTATETLSDRVLTGCRLLRDGHGKRLVLSGSADTDAGLESESMKQIAIAAGVAETVLLLHDGGSKQVASIRFVAGLPELNEDRRVIVVSHWYQLARARLLARRSGLSVAAVAAEQQHALFGQNLLVAKEVSALLLAFVEPGLDFVRTSAQPSDPQLHGH